MYTKIKLLSFGRRRFRLLVSAIIAIALQWSLVGILTMGSNSTGVPAASAASDPVIAAAGDIVCDPGSSSYNNDLGTSNSCHMLYTSNLLVNTGLTAVLNLGDNQYYCGSYQAYSEAYALSWGRVLSITHPSVGNHEYLTSGGTGCTSANAGAAGYFQYFGSAAGSQGQGYYSFDIGSWHLIALNSNCSDAGGCGSSSAQYTWLQNDLATHPTSCTLAFWHIPLFSNGGRANSNSQPFWNLLYQYHADVVLNGHDHIYERYALQSPSGAADANGIREFIVGTGGANHTSIVSSSPNEQVINDTTFGVLRLTLHSTSYDWQFVPEAGYTFTDSGTTTCHNAAAAPTPTSGPSSTPTLTPTLGPSPTSTSTSTPTFTPTFTPTPTISYIQTLTFTPVADTYVSAAHPDRNYGSYTSLRVESSPDTHAYIRFSVSGTSIGAVTSVKLRLYANNNGSLGAATEAVADNTWGELTTTYNNAPPLGNVLATAPAFNSGTWVEMDVTAYVTGDGTYSFGVTSPATNLTSLASRESGANAPQLVVTLNLPTPTPTPAGTLATDTPTFTATPTDTPTFTDTPTDTPLFTDTPTDTPAFTNTPTDTPLFTNTPTDTPAFTSTPTATPLFTNTPISTSVFMATPTGTPTLTSTATPTATLAATPTPTATSGTAQTITFVPVADSYVNSQYPDTNYGSSTSLRVDGSPTVNAYIKFSLTGISGTVTSATLKIYANSSGSQGIDGWSVADNSWGELTITYNNAPSMGSVIASAPGFTSGSWVSLDVTSYITGNGTFSIGITDPSSTAINLASRESGANSPQLVVTYH